MKHRLAPLPLAITSFWLLGLVIIISLSVLLSDGRFIYSLDDPYIHLAVAETILGGGYGLNLAEFSAPSSSILWPLMLSLTEALGLGPIGPIILNTIASGLSVFLVVSIVDRYVLSHAPRNYLFAVPLCILLVFGLNGFGLPMTGMEHPWHVLLVVFAISGLVRTAESGQPNWQVFVAIVLMPLFRFEGIVLSALLLLALLWLGQKRQAFATFAITMPTLATYAIVMR